MGGSRIPPAEPPGPREVHHDANTLGIPHIVGSPEPTAFLTIEHDLVPKLAHALVAVGVDLLSLLIRDLLDVEPDLVDQSGGPRPRREGRSDEGWGERGELPRRPKKPQ